jgi:CO/xanthine dehydrogenase FAD-binding subunit
LRNQATLAGTLISEPAAVLAVALLALDARVTVMGAATQTFALDAWLAARAEMPPSLVIEIGVPMSNPRAALCAVARTPSDKAIVCAVVAAQIENGIARDVRIALGGVGATATRAPAAEQTLRAQTLDDATIQNAARLAAQGISPRGDFRGSAEYRIEMAHVLTRRALKELAS